MNTARPIWKGSISFGLVMIPVTLFPTETQTSTHFHLLDKRNHARIRYERINEKTGKIVPWNMVVKAYEFEKGNYVIIDEEELEKTAYKNYDAIEIENFISSDSIDPLYFEKGYYISPSKAGEKGYALLQKTLETTQKAGVAKVVIRSKQHLAVVLPYQGMLILNLMHFPDEIRSYKEFEIPESHTKTLKISSKEVAMAERLVKSMTSKWDPKQYHDENREILHNWIENKIKTGKSITEPLRERVRKKSGKVIDFMTLLQKSIAEKEKKTSHASTKKVNNKNKVSASKNKKTESKKNGKNNINDGRTKGKRARK